MGHVGSLLQVERLLVSLTETPPVGHTVRCNCLHHPEFPYTLAVDAQRHWLGMLYVLCAARIVQPATGPVIDNFGPPSLAIVDVAAAVSKASGGPIVVMPAGRLLGGSSDDHQKHHVARRGRRKNNRPRQFAERRKQSGLIFVQVMGDKPARIIGIEFGIPPNYTVKANRTESAS